eukprot:SAG22_NODE_8389_length_659_cov_1.869643_1_plen_44_part_00
MPGKAAAGRGKKRKREAPPGKAVEKIVAHTYDEDGNPADYLVS